LFKYVLMWLGYLRARVDQFCLHFGVPKSSFHILHAKYLSLGFCKKYSSFPKSNGTWLFILGSVTIFVKNKFLIPQNHDMKDFAFFTEFCYHEKSTKFSYGAKIVLKTSFWITNQGSNFFKVHLGYFITNHNNSESISNFYKDCDNATHLQLKVPHLM